MLTNRAFSALVESGTYPEQVSVPLDEPFVNENGSIQNLLLERFTSAAIITSVPGAVRANHYHKTDWHYSYVISGSIRYFWRSVGSKAPPQEELFRRWHHVLYAAARRARHVFSGANGLSSLSRRTSETMRITRPTLSASNWSKRADPSVEGGWRIHFPSSS